MEVLNDCFQGVDLSLMTIKDNWTMAMSYAFLGDVPKTSLHLSYICSEQMDNRQQAILLFAAFSHLFCECGSPEMFLCIMRWATDFTGTGFKLGVKSNISTYIVSNLAVILDPDLQLQVVQALLDHQGFLEKNVDAVTVQEMWREYPETGSERLSRFEERLF